MKHVSRIRYHLSGRDVVFRLSTHLILKSGRSPHRTDGARAVDTRWLREYKYCRSVYLSTLHHLCLSTMPHPPPSQHRDIGSVVSYTKLFQGRLGHGIFRNRRSNAASHRIPEALTTE